MKKRIAPFLIVITLLVSLFALPVMAVGDVIDFTRDNFTLYPNQSYQLNMKNNAAVTSYASSDPGVVTVNEAGIVSALKAGTSLVTATDDKGNQATCTVTVRSGTAPQRVTVTQQNIALTEGETYTIKAAVEPADVNDPRLFYSSSNPSVARVDKDGNVKALKAGDAVITVESGSIAVMTQCIVKVAANAERNFSVSLNGTLYSIAGEKKPNMVVELLNTDESFETTTDTDGKFYFDDILRGTYTLRIFKKTQRATPLASGQLTVGNHDMALSWIINNKELVILYQNEKEGTEKVTDVLLEKTSLTLEPGTSYDMSFRVQPANAVLPNMKASSDNEAVAIADVDGHITALSEGTATITFTVADNKNIVRSCKVTVTPANNTTASWIIILTEFSILLLIVMIFFISYSKFKRKKERDEGLINPKYGRRAK